MRSSAWKTSAAFQLDAPADARGGHLLGGSAGTALGAGAGVRQASRPRRCRGRAAARQRPWLSLQALRRHLDARERLLSRGRAADPRGRACLPPRRHAEASARSIGVAPDEPVAEAIGRFHHYGISQLPVMQDNTVVGSLTETQLLQRFASGERLNGQRVRDWQGPPLPTLPETATVREAYTRWWAARRPSPSAGRRACAASSPSADLMEFWAQSGGAAVSGSGEQK